ncbi:sperm flagellar protein 2 isoform X2 [Paralichthys olivaceus]|uniref:sperm flagellar protein 2 isoform X2 n=1 Tax=Paralichthys olivaceus TaxID=8255 RepID=UPI00097D134E|nr:PREDICTED: sperm flagellar protein 2 isoform X2 [Paralichthys olivaceus]
MSDILCRWLNQELRLSKAVEPQSFAKDFSTGYLIGEVLHKYQLQSDFTMFMRKDTSISKLNNFTRLEPTLQLLGISFDTNTVQGLMQEKQGVATHLLYQLYISLEKKKRAEITGTMMEIMQPAANAGLHKKEHDIYSDRLHQVVKRDAELKLQKISWHYQAKYEQLNYTPVMTHPIQPKRPLKVQDEKRTKNIDKFRGYRQKHSGNLTYNHATVMPVPKPPPYASQLNIKTRRQHQQCTQQAQAVQAQIAQFETSRKKLVTSGFGSSSSGQPVTGVFPSSGSSYGTEAHESGNKLKLKSDSQYIQEIRQRLKENAISREQREKRRDRFLVEQLKAHEAQEEARREEQLVKHLTRQTQQEQRLASQLLQMRMQKEVIRQNRVFREQQFQQRRERDFQEALEREAALVQQAKLDRAEEIKKELEFLDRVAAERAQSRYKKHFRGCKDILEQIVDLATKTGEYRLITANRIPEKLTREWKELLFSGIPLYEPIMGQQPGFEFSTSLDPVELEKQEILNNQDYDEYTNMVGEWVWPEKAGETKSPPSNNSILGHVVLRLRNIVHPPIVKATSLSFPHFTVKACVLGKFCSGKTTCLAKIAEANGICVLSADTLIEEALNAYHKEKKVTEQQGETDEPLLSSSTSVKSDRDTQEENGDSNERLSTRAVQGAAAEKELRRGNPIPNELLVDIIVEAIKQVPAQSGWILDGFPVDINQAYLLEKALGGAVDIGSGVESSRADLAVDPYPPKPLPPQNPVLDVVLLLDIPDEAVAGRAFAHTDTSSPSTDKNVYLAQIPHRIKAFQDTWLKLEKWFGGKQNILVRVDASVVKEELYKKVESVLQQVMMQMQQAPATSPVEEVSENGKAPDSSPKGTPLPVDQPPPLTDEAPGPTESPTNPPASASPCPVSSSWVYVDQPLPLEISEYLCTHWETVCDSYVNNIKTVMQQLRSQNIVISHHLFNLREEFQHYLKRPDMMQELVTHWQKDFNNISDDMREDDETKAELHLRLDELRERLWDMSDKRKERDEQERDALMYNGWLEEHTAILINHHSTLMQVELDRFQETLCILRIYYVNMYKQVGPEPLSDLVCIPLLGIEEDKDQDKSAEPADTSGCVQLDDREERRKTKLIPFLSKHPDSSERAPKTQGVGQTQLVKPSAEKLISDYEEALRAISKLVSAEGHQGETKEQKDRLQEKESTASASKKGKGKQSQKKQKAPTSTPPSPSPVPAEDSHDQSVRDKIQKEYAAALEHEENAAKVRIALVKGHGLVMVQTMQNRAEQVFSKMEKWLEAYYLSEMKSIDQLAEVVHHHIEAGAKLRNELVLESTDFCLNGDCYMVASPTPPPHPPLLEKATLSTPTIKQLESLHHQLCSIAPSGLMSSCEFSNLLRDITSVNMGRDVLPEAWINIDERQLTEIVSMLMDQYDLIDWRRFLLSAALPWPFPSIPQLLAVLKRFKEADTGNTGYINMEQYLQTELWFSGDSVKPAPEDPAEPLPYDRLANLRKFFFQLFADHSSSPPRLDYVSMLQYFAADPNPQEGFFRALSVVLGQHVGEHTSQGHLVKSMPSIEEPTELSPSEPDEETSSPLADPGVSIPALLSVICHKVTKMKDTNVLPPGCLSEEQLVHLFSEHGYTPESCVPFSILSQHFIQSLMKMSTHHQLVNIHGVLQAHQSEEEAYSSG